jgi:predicted metal-dependent peptidase
MRPNRRFVAEGIYLPGRGKPSLGDVVVFVDTSGSVSDKLLSFFLGEVEGVLKAHPARVFLVACDAEPWLVGEYDNAYDFPLEVPIKGRGGTDFRTGVKWIEDHSGAFCEGEQYMDETPRIAIYLTDGMGDYPKELPEGLDMLWVLSKNWEKGSPWYPPVGEVIIAFEDLD